MTGKPATEAPVKGGRNYNGPKASQKVTEACKGFLRLDGNQPLSVKAKGSLTARPTRRVGTKVGLSDPTVPSGRVVAQRIKVTLGITGVEEPHQSIPNLVVKLYYGDNTVGEALRKNSWTPG
ncbi:unnamed protein product [Sphagnum compactum]